jgi:predicted metal-binding protein
MAKKDQLEEMFARHGFTDFKWIKAKDIRIAQWVRLRCMFGCPAYGVRGSCPPNVPSIEQCRELFSEYDEAAIFHFEKALRDPEERKPWGRDMASGLLKLERDVFLSGYYKAFMIMFDACNRCDECAGNRMGCKDKRSCRPGADAMGIDVYATVRSVGYHVQPLKDYHEAMNRYAFLMVE